MHQISRKGMPDQRPRSEFPARLARDLFAAGFGLLRDGQDGVQLGCDLRVQLVLGNQPSEDMVVGFAEQIGQSELFEEALENGIEELIAGLDVGRPGAGAAQSGERLGSVLWRGQASWW